ncbi:MAG: STAS/SEC14 domain-containing protein [Solirubrobacterales bacterium]
MIEPLENLPDGVIGFRAIGVIEPDDYKTVLDPAVDAAAADGPLRIVFVIGDDFDRYSLGALWQDTKLGMSHGLKAWSRVAFVTNHDWIAHAASIFAPLMPGELKLFPVDQVDEAAVWAAEN